MNPSSKEPKPEQRNEPFEIDPDKRDWEYDGNGRRVPKGSVAQQDSASMVKLEITRDF